ncbi:porin family protein [Franzmannia qiaohouensis]|uniref:Porin family protein n=1 Tax=Franzmannia qiaohouensis TaxID=1329370 RepID=A0ABU1HHN9_9GAMM|nr:porin family protein [Halomonas qiaohouensis]MDR5907012.1 porin family protein [Halomonas qiaohouensis]
MKKTVLAVSTAALFGASASTLAATPTFYVGGQLGYQNVDMEESETWQGGSFSQDYSVSGLAGGLFAGARFDVTPKVFLAPEVNIGTSNADGGWTNGSGNFFEFEAKNSYGFAVLTGYSLADATDVYARLGYQRTKFEATSGGPNLDNASASDTFGGFRYGVGMETAIGAQTALRLDWSQTRYSSESYDGGFNNTTTFDPTESLFQVGIVVSF